MKTLKWLIGIVAAFLILLLGLQARQSAQTAAAQSTTTVVGEQKTIGKGTVRTWVKVDAKTREPRNIGVTITEQGLTGLPAEADAAQAGSAKLKLMDGGPDHTFEYELKFPP